jgi:hypothetical protein
VIELYAIAQAPGPRVADPLRAVPAGELLAVCGPAEDEVTPDALWRREALLEGLMEAGDVLPVRYGTRLGDEAEAARAVAERSDELLATLERVRGAVELSVRVVGDGAEAVHEVLRPLARDARRLPSSGEFRAAYLVDRDGVDPFVAEVAGLQRTTTDLQLLCTGPWPPYSFAGP